MAWLVKIGIENVTIYDRLDSFGNGNIRYQGVIDNALASFAYRLQEVDELRGKLEKAEAEVVQLKTKMVR